MLKIFNRLVSVYHIFTKDYRLIWTRKGNPPFPKENCLEVLFLYETRMISVKNDGDIPKETIATLKRWIAEQEEENAKN